MSNTHEKTLKSSNNNSGSHPSPILILACAIFAIGLISLALLGLQSRYMQDDYCFDFLLKQDGFLTAQWHTYFEETAFNGNRYAANFIMGLAALLGTRSAQIMPLIILAAITASLYFLLTQLNRYSKALPSPCSRLMVTFALVFLTYILTPNLFQSLYWRPASVTYSLPIAFVFLLAAVVVNIAQRLTFKTGYALLIFLLAFIAGGFAEHMVTLTFCALALALLFAFMTNSNPNLKKPLIVALIGTAAALLVMIVSPAAHLRQAVLFPQPPSLGTGLGIAFSAVNHFILRALYRLPMHTLWTLLLFILCGYILKPTQPESEDGIKMSMRLGLTVLLGYGLLFSVCLPGAVTTSAPPEERAQVLLSLVWVLSLAVIGWQIGRYVRGACAGVCIAMGGLLVFGLGLSVLVPAEQTFSPAYPEIRTWITTQPVQMIALLVLAALVVFLQQYRSQVNFQRLFAFAMLAAVLLAALPGLVSIANDLPERRNQAALWDWREGQIEHALRRGQYNLALPALDSISGVLELQTSQDHWVNNCAELFYGLDSLRAEEPLLTRIPEDE